MNNDTSINKIEQIKFEKFKILIEIILQRFNMPNKEIYKNCAFYLIFNDNDINERSEFIIRYSTSEYYFRGKPSDYKKSYIDFCKSDLGQIESCRFIFWCYMIAKTDNKNYNHHKVNIDKFATEIGIIETDLHDIQRLVNSIDQWEKYKVRTPLTVAALGNIFMLPLFEEVEATELEEM